MNSFADSNPEQLLTMAREGDHRALGQLLDLYRNYLSLLARVQIGRRLRRQVDASDVVQEAFLKANLAFSQFRGTTERELLAWLRQILARQLADLVRKYCRAGVRELHRDEDIGADIDRSSRSLGLDLAAAGSTPSEKAVRREHAVLLADALEALPADYREVIVLRHLEQLTFPQVASRMDRSVDSVKNIWRRALVQLNRSLSGVL